MASKLILASGIAVIIIIVAIILLYGGVTTAAPASSGNSTEQPYLNNAQVAGMFGTGGNYSLTNATAPNIAEFFQPAGVPQAVLDNITAVWQVNYSVNASGTNDTQVAELSELVLKSPIPAWLYDYLTPTVTNSPVPLILNASVDGMTYSAINITSAADPGWNETILTGWKGDEFARATAVVYQKSVNVQLLASTVASELT